jgi:hypothetical protein
VLVYLATRVAAEEDPPAIAVAVALREGELERFKTLTADHSESISIAEFITTGESSALLAAATSRHWPEADALTQCLRGFYLRLRLLSLSGLRQHGQAPSLFVRLRGDVGLVDSALRSAASDFGEDRDLYVSVESSSPVMAAERVLGTVVASYRDGILPPDYVDAFRGSGRPTGWIHYTLDPACRCLGCFDALSAVSSSAD